MLHPVLLVATSHAGAVLLVDGPYSTPQAPSNAMDWVIDEFFCAGGHGRADGMSSTPKQKRGLDGVQNIATLQ